jgi:hypothetical protein
LNFASGDLNFGKDPSVGTGAYTNSFAGATTTTLYNYDDSLNVLTTQVPPNDGKLNTIGSSGLLINLADQSTDLDIFYDKIALTNRAYLAANVGAAAFDNLYTVNLASGVATPVGKIGFGSSIVDLAAFIAPRVSVACPPNITLTVPLGSSTVIGDYTAPIAASGCPLGTNPAILRQGLPSGSAFTGGINTVCYSASDNCGNTNTCCFSITVNETPCDEKTIGCIKFEMLSIRKDARNNNVMRVRVTNNCASPLAYVAFQVQNGTQAISPINGTMFLAATGNQYMVRTPNFSPFYSIRFQPTNAGIQNGAADIFEYVLPASTGLRYFHVVAKTVQGQSSEAYLASFNCVLSPNPMHTGNYSISDPAEPITLARNLDAHSNPYPNPSENALFIDIPADTDLARTVSVFSVSGHLLGTQRVEPSASTETIDLSSLSQTLSNGLYFIEVRSGDGTKNVMRWTLQR